MKNAAAAPLFERAILYTVPAVAFTFVALLVAALLSVATVGVTSVVSVVFAVTVPDIADVHRSDTFTARPISFVVSLPAISTDWRDTSFTRVQWII